VTYSELQDTLSYHPEYSKLPSGPIDELIQEIALKHEGTVTFVDDDDGDDDNDGDDDDNDDVMVMMMMRILMMMMIMTTVSPRLYAECPYLYPEEGPVGGV